MPPLFDTRSRVWLLAALAGWLLANTPLTAGAADPCDKPCKAKSIAAATTISGEPVRTNVTYDVSGADCDEVSAAIFDAATGAGPVIGGARRAAITTCDIGASFTNHEDTRDCCNGAWVCTEKLNAVTATLAIEVKTPNWSDVPDPVPAEWTSFVAGIATHEQGHVDICTAQFALLKTALAGVAATNACGSSEKEDPKQAKQEATTAACDAAFASLDAAVAALVNQYTNAIAAAFTAYDSPDQTNHGATQGATLTCP